ncbi:MAG: Flp pilus assembly complex ATPase component TadA [Lentisphaerae bacterium]|nr:Flp pilus assembly complex ATPase component TadA [Lentisphaerota bacterium]
MDRQSFSDKLSLILLRRGMISPAALQEAQQTVQEQGQRLEEYLVAKQVVNETQMTLAIAEFLGLAPISLAHFIPDESLLKLVPRETIKRCLVIPLAKVGKVLTVALSDPFNVGTLDELQSTTGLKIVPVVSPEKEVKDVLQKFYEQTSPDLQQILENVAGDEEVEVSHEKQEEISLDEMLSQTESAPVIRIVNSIIVEALRRRASDIHMQPMEKTLRLRYRIDGDLYEVPSAPKNLQAAIVSRIKIMANMNIAERRVPQDGRFRVKALGKEVDVRVNLLPMIFGEKVAMRILDKASLAPSLAALELDKRAYEAFAYAISQPHGIILVTGPTGSGKTTTLYSALQDLNKMEVNIVTTEDPVEYQLAGINQVQVNEKVGLTFAGALRSILRQDPDIVMVGEIRDLETAAIAVKSALTGHLVLSTLHTNDAATSVTRLRDMGVEPFLLASCLVLGQAQRLYKKLCPACRKPAKLSLENLRMYNLDAKYFEGATLFTAAGCPKCLNIGYRGRGALMEVLPVDDAIRHLILKNASTGEIAKKAVENGMLTLRMVGLEKVKQGITTLEEVLSETGGD